MELEFERDILMDHEIVTDVTLCQEETLESIVPDACPDILQIVDVCGQAMLTGKQAEEGTATVSGLVRAVILYQPEEGLGLRRMEVSLPFTCQASAPGLTGTGMILASPRLRMAEARALNPRKVLLRIDLAVEVMAFQPVERHFCTGVTNETEASICQKQLQEEHVQQLSVQEKPFSFSDQIRLPSGQSEGGQLLTLRANPLCTESRLIGNKLIFKGNIELYFLMQQPDGNLTQCRETLPFSQIIEVTGETENSECLLRIELVDIHYDSQGDGRMLDLSFELLAQAQVLCRRPITVLQDLYSTAWELEAELKTQPILRFVELSVHPQPVRDLMETDQIVRTVVDSRVALGQVTQKLDSDGLHLDAEAWTTVLFLDEENQLNCARKMIPVHCVLPVPEHIKCICRCSVPGDVYASPSASGLELRFSMEFQSLITQSIEMPAVSRASLGAERNRDGSARPSIVLRMMGEQESLWDIAKWYGTTTERILQANELSEGTIPNGKMLLIPSIR